jgi:hypothetical protein
VPSARRTLAKEKRSGPLREYLEDLQSNDERPLERWFYTDWLRKLRRQQDMAARAAARRAAAAAGGEAQQAQPDQQQQQPVPAPAPDEYVDRQPAFFSLDNPLLAAAALIAAAGGVSTLLRSLAGGGA